MTCDYCGHGWHGIPCTMDIAAGGLAVDACGCPASALDVPTAAEYLAGARNPVAEALRAEAKAATA